MPEPPIEISSDEDEYEYSSAKRDMLQPVVTRVVDALGGVEGGVYRMGDEVSACLRDLKKLWRKDDTDDDRTVARLLWESRVLINDLVPILLATAGQGMLEDRRAIACADLITAMTWPIDMAEELKELDDDLDKGTDYTQLYYSHLAYKAALLKPGVLQALLGIMLAPLSKAPKEREERDGQIINVVLHLIRNLAFVKDLPINTHSSADQAEFSTLQSKFIKGLAEAHIFQFLLTIASNTHNDPLFTGWNTLVLEIFYLLLRGVKPKSLAADQSKQPTAKLQSLLAAETRGKNEVARKASTRHSRFGTTITVSLNTKKHRPDNGDGEGANNESKSGPSFILHRQRAINHDSGSIMDMSKKSATKKFKTNDELTREDYLSVEAKTTLRALAIEVLDACFNPFLASVLKDIRSERAKITEKDNLRLLYVTKWFLEFFLTMRANAKAAGDEARWNFGLIAEVTERSWIIWVLKRMREAVEEKPKLWTELQAGIECLTQFLALIDTMTSSEIADPALSEAAETLQQQLIYNGEILDIAFDSLRSYKEGTQSLVHLDASIHLSYALLRMLERWGKGDGVYVRKKSRRKKKGKGDEEMNEEEEAFPEKEEIVTEALFSFEAFQMKFAHADITQTLLTYLARYKEFSSSESMRRVVSLMHRQAVKSKAEGLFFQASTLVLFKTILDEQKSLPREQPYKDLINLINFILRQFFKAMEKDSFLAIEAFFPKNRGHWKQYSSWEPEVKERRQRAPLDERFSQDVQVKKGYSWSEELGIAIACLIEDGKQELVEWTTSILRAAIDERKRIIEETDNPEGTERPSALEDNLDDADAAHRLLDNGPSKEAMAKMQDYLVPYTGDEGDNHAQAATKNPHLKLLFRLCRFHIMDEDADEFEWYIPAVILVSDLERYLKVIDQYLQDPIDLEGRKATQCLSKKSRRRKTRRSPSPDSDGDFASDDETKARRKKRKERKQKEQVNYKSAQFIEDSDDEYEAGNENWEAFLAKEAAQRERTAQNTHGTMRATGTKKRRLKDQKGNGRKKRKGSMDPDSMPEDAEEGSEHEGSEQDDDGMDQSSDEDVPPPPQPRPRPKPRKRVSSPTPSLSSEKSSGADPDD